MKQMTFDRLDELFAESPILVARDSVSDDEIRAAEARLGLARCATARALRHRSCMHARNDELEPSTDRIEVEHPRL